MRLAYFSPLPPSKSGIADYSVELLPVLALGAEISVFVEKLEESLMERNGYAVFEARDFERLNREQPFDLSIYHQGNNPITNTFTIRL
jgi:hypothetical protein